MDTSGRRHHRNQVRSGVAPNLRNYPAPLACSTGVLASVSGADTVGDVLRKRERRAVWSIR